MTFRELYALNNAWEGRTTISVEVETNPQIIPAPMRGTARNMLEIFGDARVVSFGIYKVVLAYEDYVSALGIVRG